MDSKEAKNSKEKKDIKDINKRVWYYIIIILIVIIIVIGYFYYVKQNEISGLQNQINQLENNNTDLNNQITGYSVRIDSLKSFSKSVKSGNVAFWEENGEDVISAQVPLNFYSARIFSENIVSKFIDDSGSNDYTFKNIKKNMSIWTANFVCRGAVNDSNCGAQVVIDEGQKSYSYSTL